MACLIYWVSVTAVLEGSFPNFSLIYNKKQHSLVITNQYVWYWRNAGDKVTLLTGGWRLQNAGELELLHMCTQSNC